MDSIKDLVTKLTEQEESNKRNEKCKKGLQEDVQKVKKGLRKKQKLLKSYFEWEIKYGKKLESEIIVLKKRGKTIEWRRIIG